MQNEVEVMRVIREPPMGSLIVHAGGRRLKHLSSAENEQMRHRLLAAIGELVTFAGGYDALVEAGVAPPLGPREINVAGTTQPAEDELTAQQAAFLDQLERELKSGVPPEGLLTGSVPDSVAINAAKFEAGVDDGREVSTKPGAEQPASGQPGVNLVGEIDSILQKHVIANARLAHRSIHLRQPPGGLLQIVVDDRVYEHPNDIEDDDVRQILKQALKEWESR